MYMANPMGLPFSRICYNGIHQSVLNAHTREGKPNDGRTEESEIKKIILLEQQKIVFIDFSLDALISCRKTQKSIK